MIKALSIIGAVALGAVGMWLYQPKAVAVPPLQPPLVSLEHIGHLASVKVNYANVIEAAEKLTQDIPKTPFELRFGTARVLLVARGDCMVGTDLRRAQYQAVDNEKRTADLVLPAPALLSAKVNHASRAAGGSYFFAMTGSGLEPFVPGTETRTKAVDTALNKAQADIAKACTEADVLATAKKNAESVLLPLLAASGWQIKVKWLP